jgi:CpXC motif protein
MNQEVSLTCPLCAQVFSATIWQSVNVTLSPELKAQILDGTLNEPRCPRCGCAVARSEPLLYHDMEKGLMFYVIPIADEAGRNRAQDQFQEILASQDAAANIYCLEGMANLRKIITTLDTAQNADGTPLDFTKPREWKNIVDLILKPPFPWPLDHKCLCGEAIPIVCFCREPGVPINIKKYEPNIPPNLKVSCKKCRRRLIGFHCEKCSQVYQWNVGVVPHAARRVRAF